MRFTWLGLGSIALAATAAFSASKPVMHTLVRGEAPEFPPGVFTDGGQYHVDDFKGKVLVLYFFEPACPTARGLVPQRNTLVESFKGQPVKFIAIGPNDSLGSMAQYSRETKLAMPIFADRFGVMETRYHENISMQNIYQMKVIGPTGNIVGFSEDSIRKSVDEAKWKYKDDGYDKKLATAVELFEWNQYEAGMKSLKPYLKSTDKAVAESAQKLFAVIKTEGEQWKSAADGEADSDPVGAYDAYTKLAAVFPGDDLGKSADEPLKKLKALPAVKDELSARRMWLDLPKAMSNATDAQKPEVVKFCQNLAKKYPETPTAAKATSLADELQNAKSAE